jgi:RAB protein geranylgeranyltransferase component A
VLRACAVFGGTYVLGPSAVAEFKVPEDNTPETTISLKLPCHPRLVTARNIISSAGHLPPQLRPIDAFDSSSQTPAVPSSADTLRNTTAHCIAILSSLPASLRSSIRGDGTDFDKVGETEQPDTAVIVFPPEGDSGLVRALIMGEGTGSCPAGQCGLP